MEFKIDKLKEYLLNLPSGRYIGKIVLFGSYAKGYASDSSDIDLLLITTNGKEIRKEILDSVYDFMVEEGLPLEVILAHVNDIYFPKDYFLSNVLRYGVEVYSMDGLELKRSVIEGLLELAEEYLKGAEEILQSGHVRIAIDAGYNGAELAIKALILLKQDDLPGSHGGIASLFGQLYIKSGEVNRELGRALNRALELRNRVRYRIDASFSKEEAYSVIDLAREIFSLAGLKKDAFFGGRKEK